MTAKNSELGQTVAVRNNAINELSTRAKTAEAAVLGDLEATAKYMYAGNVITINGISYPMDKFPSNFIDKARNIINNSQGKILPL